MAKGGTALDFRAITFAPCRYANAYRGAAHDSVKNRTQVPGMRRPAPLDRLGERTNG
jgi:hypothetical protein